MSYPRRVVEEAEPCLGVGDMGCCDPECRGCHPRVNFTALHNLASSLRWAGALQAMFDAGEVAGIGPRAPFWRPGQPDRQAAWRPNVDGMNAPGWRK